MLLSRLSARLVSVTSLGMLVFVFGSFSPQRATAATIAATGAFEAGADNIPDSAATRFFEPDWSNGDPLNTAEHELFHAIGFTINYKNFADHVRPALTPPLLNAGDRPFNSKTDGTGTTLALLTPASDGTHVDPGAGVVNGRNQNLSIMQPNLVNNQRLSQWEADILNAAFSWNTRNIQIKVVYANVFTAAQKKSITDAVAAVNTLFGSDGTGYLFTWTVATVPEPSSYVMMSLAMVGMAAFRRYRGVSAPAA